MASMHRSFPWRSALAIAMVCSPVAHQSRISQEYDQIAFTADLTTLDSLLVAMHPAFKDGLDQTGVRRALAMLGSSPPRSRSAALVGLAEALALLHDGHTKLWLYPRPWNNAVLRFHLLPLRLYAFHEGIFVVATDTLHSGLLGARVTRWGSAGIKEAFRRVARGAAADNSAGARSDVPLLLTVPELLMGVGLIEHADSVGIRLRLVNGRDTSLVLAAGAPADTALLVPHELFLRPCQSPCAQALPGVRAVYLRLDDLERNNGTAIQASVRRAMELIDQLGDARLMVDLRGNGGGDHTLAATIVAGIQARAGLAARTVVLTGRRTFSAGLWLALDLEGLGALTMGEDTGGTPNHFGEVEVVTLPRTGLRVAIATELNQRSRANDTRRALAPRIRAGPSIRDFRQHRDGALDQALTLRIPSSRDTR